MDRFDDHRPVCTAIPETLTRSGESVRESIRAMPEGSAGSRSGEVDRDVERVPWVAGLCGWLSGVWLFFENSTGCSICQCHLFGIDCLFCRDVFVGEFDPGSGRTLAACLTHASRAERPLFGVLERRTGE